MVKNEDKNYRIIILIQLRNVIINSLKKTWKEDGEYLALNLRC